MFCQMKIALDVQKWPNENAKTKWRTAEIRDNIKQKIEVGKMPRKV